MNMKSLLAAVATAVAVSTGTRAEESPLVLFTAVSGRPGKAEAADIVRRSRAAGFSQWVVYPRSGLELEYMGEEWLSFVGAFLAEARAQGGHVWLYDEYNWPSGSCKGRVPRENPAWTYSEYAVRTNADGSFAWEVKRNDRMSMYDKYFDVNAYSAGAIRRFIELTHEVYEKRFGEFFRDGTIRGVFTDEPGHPSVMTWEGAKPVVTFRWWAELEEQYRMRTGREFRADVEASLREPAKTGVWELYTELKGRQFRRAYFDPIAAWCRKMGIESCGHMIAEGSPHKSCDFNGLPLETIRGLTLPGMDKIGMDITPTCEWLTYATAQYGIERNSRPGETLTAHGGIELFALGPVDLTQTQLAQRIWICSLYGMDTYFMSLYHLTGRGFLEKGGYAMFTSPTQPYFDRYADVHAAAKDAAKWSRKKFLREVAIRYPQRTFGRLALGRGKPGEKDPPLVELVNACAWNQVSFELLQEDDPCSLPFVFSLMDGRIVEERTGRTFASAADAVVWLHAETDRTWRVFQADGTVRPGVLVRHYADGTGVVQNLTEDDAEGLRLGRGDVFDLPSCGHVFFGLAAKAPAKTVRVGAVKAPRWTISLDRPNLQRIWFPSNNVARLTVTAPVEKARWLVCNHPEGLVRVSVNGRPLDARLPATQAPYAYAELYRATAPFTLAPGEYELTLSGRGDDSVFLPVLWLSGPFVAREPGVVETLPQTCTRLGSLYDLGLGDFAGSVTYAAEMAVDGCILALETGGLVTQVRLGGVDLGVKGVAPFTWRIPEGLVGMRTNLEVTVMTSARPTFGRAPLVTNDRGRLIGGGRDCVTGVRLAQPLWCATIQDCDRGGLHAGEWRRTPTP